jgi:hypothetical protein
MIETKQTSIKVINESSSNVLQNRASFHPTHNHNRSNFPSLGLVRRQFIFPATLFPSFKGQQSHLSFSFKSPFLPFHDVALGITTNTEKILHELRKSRAIRDMIINIFSLFEPRTGRS